MFTSLRFFPIKVLWKTFFPYKKLYSCSLWLSGLEEKERRQTLILKSASFSFEEWHRRWHRFGLDLLFDGQKVKKNSEGPSSQNAKLWLAQRATGFWSWLARKFFYPPWATGWVHFCSPERNPFGEIDQMKKGSITVFSYKYLHWHGTITIIII